MRRIFKSMADDMAACSAAIAEYVVNPEVFG